ncbi:MAG: hypothetical protein HF962_09055 [Sulfurovum sp.]|nr:hypothetical protein [Sulfurovum sp.]
MHLLEYFYELSPKNDFFRERKLQLPEDHSFILNGARGTGKTTLILEHLKEMPEDIWLYIDCQDPIFALEDIDVDTLNEFIQQEKIETIVLDHYYTGFLKELPKCFQLVIASRDTVADTNIEKLTLYPLDYEEFLSFDRGASPSVSFNHFLKAGTLPISVSSSFDSRSLQMRSFFYASFDEDESRLMLILAKYQGHRVTIHQLYTYAKDYFRISKDWTYRTIKRFTQEGLVLFIDDIDRKGARKMILYDFALSKYLSKSQPFSITFDAIVVLALFKHNIPFQAIGIHGYLIHDNELIIASAFENEERFWKKAYNKISIYKKHDIRKVTIVSVSNTYDFELNDILFEALPFYEWSILNE